MQGLAETASFHKSGSGLELHFAVAVGQLEHVRFLVEEMHCKIDLPSLSTTVFHFTEEKHQHHDHDSGMGPSTFTDTKTTIISEVSYYLF